MNYSAMAKGEDILSVLSTDKCKHEGSSLAENEAEKCHKKKDCQSVSDIEIVPTSSSQFIRDHNSNVTDYSVTPTKIKLNFSVDRLLNFETNSNILSRSNKQLLNSSNLISSNNNNTSITNDFIINNSELLSRFECCKYLNGSFFQHHQQHNQNNGNGLMNVLSKDDTIVRPKAIRAVGNNINSGHVSSLSMPPPFVHASSSMFLGHRMTASLSPINCTINQLKSLQSHQHFRQTPNGISHKSENLTSLANISNPNITNGSASSSTGKRKRSWSRAVFSNLQRKGLEIQFQQQKYITKPDRRKLAARLNLTDAQVKVWFQNRRMKWRHTKENLKSGQEKPVAGSSSLTVNSKTNPNHLENNLRKSPESEEQCYSSSSDDDDDEIDVVE